MMTSIGDYAHVVFSRIMLVVVAVSCVTGQDVSLLRYRLVEERPPGTLVADLAQDGSFNLGETFRFLKGDYNDLFNLEASSGLLKVGERVDRDAICPNRFVCEVQLLVGAQRGGDVTNLNVIVELLDLNDNSPAFPQSYMSLTISETASDDARFPIQPAIDPDSPPNSSTTYELVSSDSVFSLVVKNNTDTFGTIDIELVLDGELDRERKPFYQLSVLALDSGGLEPPGRLIIDVEVDDVNDNIPAFPEPSSEIDVPEDTPVGSTLITVHADDPDTGVNGEVTYQFAPATLRRYAGQFHVDATTGDVTLTRELDFEVSESYSLVIQAVDGGIGSVPGVTTVVVRVTDVNDNAPTVIINTDSDDDELWVVEHGRPNQFVVHLSVVDQDSGSNGQVQCNLISDDFTLVQLYDSEYKIVTAHELDREVKASYRILFSCRDDGVPPKHTAVNITVNVEDINDHVPVFEKATYPVRLAENNDLGAVVVQVRASDEDSGDHGHLSYMVGEDGGDMFEVDPDTGLVTALVAFDREETGYMEFHVIAADRGDVVQTAECLIQLTITDEDDEAPLFHQTSYSFGISENMAARSPVGSVTADDRDLPPYNRLTYHLDLHNLASQDFSVDPASGLISTKRVLDRENIASYRLTVLAQSDTVPPLTDSCTVTILVTDENDNAPVITFPTTGNNTVNMPVNLKVGAQVTTIEAYDVDGGVNGVLRYMISEGNVAGEFRVEEHTGRILVNSDPNSFTQTLYNLIIMVRDSGQPEQISMATLVIVLVAPPKVTTPVLIVDFTDTSGVQSPSTNSGDDKSSGFSRRHLAVVLGVVLGCILLALILVLAVIIFRRRKRHQTRKPENASDDLYWPQAASGTTSPRSHGVLNNASQEETDASRMTEISHISDMMLALDTDATNFQSQSTPSDDHSPKSDRDCDSGCADLSNSGSQTSSEDSDGSKRSSKASDSGGGNEIPLTAILSRPHMMLPTSSTPSVPHMLPSVSAMPLLHQRLAIDRPGSATPDFTYRRAQRYPSEDDNNFRRTFSTPPKGQMRGALQAITRGHQQPSFPQTQSSYGLRDCVVSTLPRTLSSCSGRKAVRFSDEPHYGSLERPETPKSEKRVHFADEDDVFNTSYFSNCTSDTDSTPRSPVKDSTNANSNSDIAPKSVHDNLSQKSEPAMCGEESIDMAMRDMYPNEGTYTTFMPLTNTNLSSLV